MDVDTVGFIDAVRSALAATEGLHREPLVAALLLAGLLAVVLTLRAAVVCDPRCRRPWITVAALCAVWTAGWTALVLGTPIPLTMSVWNPIGLTLVGLSMLAFPGIARPFRYWVVMTLDGWMSVGGAAAVSWILLQPVMSAEGRSPSLVVLLWAAIVFVLASVMTGLVVIAPPAARRALSMVAGAATLSAVAELTVAMTGGVHLAAMAWTLVIVLVGLSPVVGGRDLFLQRFGEVSDARVIRLSQLPLVPAVIFLFMPIEHDWLANLIAGLVVATAFGNIAWHSRQNVRLLESMRKQRAQFEAVLTGSQDAIMQLAAGGAIEFANPAATHVLGYSADELTRMLIQDLVHPEDLDRMERETAAIVQHRTGSVRVEFRLRDAAGGYRFIESTVGPRKDQDSGWVLSTRDVSASVALRDRLEQQARTDALTGLLNRAALRTAIDAELARSGRATVFFIDLDEFKAVNDTLGHAAGDDVLIQVARHLIAAMGRADGIARLGGDEFAILVPATDRRELAQIADALLAGVAQVRTPEHLPAGRASIGIVSAASGSADDLLRDADLAMYQAKAAGGDVAVEFEPVMRERMLERSRLRAKLESAIRDGALTLALQPVVELGSRRWQGFEALVRWQDGDRLRMPDDFLPLAEESGLIVPLGSWVLHTSLQFLAEWDRTGATQHDAAGAEGEPQGDPLTIAVNVSPRQLEAPGFADEVLAALAGTGIAPHRLVLEITEQTAVQDFGSTASHLALLRASGVAVAIDDFGTGYSSLRYLTRLPVDSLKIDRQFVSGLGIRAEDEVLVTSMLRLATDLGLEVIAEGVETPEQADLLRQHGCVLAQGYLFSKPIPLVRLLPGFTPVPVPSFEPNLTDAPA